MKEDFPVRGWIGCWVLFLDQLGPGSPFSLMTFLLVDELHFSVPSSSCSLQKWMSAFAHPELCLSTEIKRLEDQRGWVFVALIGMYPVAGSFPGHCVQRGCPWRTMFRDTMKIPSWRAMSEPICLNNRIISPAMSVFSDFAMAWSWSGKDPGSQQPAGETGVCYLMWAV